MGRGGFIRTFYPPPPRPYVRLVCASCTRNNTELAAWAFSGKAARTRRCVVLVKISTWPDRLRKPKLVIIMTISGLLDPTKPAHAQ